MMLANKIDASGALTETERDELKLWRALRPYLRRCLTLNHDLNNPLAGVLGYTEFILESNEPLSEDMRAHLHQIMTCGERMRDIIESLCADKVALNGDVDVSALIALLDKDPA